MLVLAVVVAAVIAAPIAFFASVDHPGRYVGDRWRSFKHAPYDESGRNHFISLGSNRYDFWRVALTEFRDHPVAGIGDRGFGPGVPDRAPTAARPRSGRIRSSSTR